MRKNFIVNRDPMGQGKSTNVDHEMFCGNCGLMKDFVLFYKYFYNILESSKITVIQKVFKTPLNL